ncbi:MAG TPA: low temperature requirement protein A [Thermoanaerobaculia bacterium]|nr:low temperature requirement protein A [Thermoanaerobaculia bacterium]
MTLAPRSRHEAHRAATPLELFFDLVFVVAIAHAASDLHHAVAGGHVAAGVLSYAMVFFAIWWAWMNFTWFGSAYDSDDVPYRLLTLAQMSGALIVAAGVPEAFAERDFGVVTLGYVVMRLALVPQWLRAARGDALRRDTARRYALGITVVQAGWVALLAAPEPWGLAGFGALALAELAVPVWAESAAPTPWHPDHIVERYGLFTIIVLGESILAASLAIQAATAGGATTGDLLSEIVGGVLIVFAMWWLYFDRPAPEQCESLHEPFVWGYGHIAVFTSAAAVGAGLSVEVDRITGHAEIGPVGGALSVAVPVALYLVALSLLPSGRRRSSRAGRLLVWIAAPAVLAAAWAGEPMLVIGFLLTVLLAIKLWLHRSARRAGPEAVAG